MWEAAWDPLQLLWGDCAADSVPESGPCPGRALRWLHPQHFRRGPGSCGSCLADLVKSPGPGAQQPEAGVPRAAGLSTPLRQCHRHPPPVPSPLHGVLGFPGCLGCGKAPLGLSGFIGLSHSRRRAASIARTRISTRFLCLTPPRAPLRPHIISSFLPGQARSDSRPGPTVWGQELTPLNCGVFFLPCSPAPSAVILAACGQRGAPGVCLGRNPPKQAGSVTQALTVWSAGGHRV